MSPLIRSSTPPPSGGSVPDDAGATVLAYPRAVGPGGPRSAADRQDERPAYGRSLLPPVVLRLPDVSADEHAPEGFRSLLSRKRVSNVLFTLFILLSIVVIVLLLTGPRSAPAPLDEAPSWHREPPSDIAVELGESASATDPARHQAVPTWKGPSQPHRVSQPRNESDAIAPVVQGERLDPRHDAERPDSPQNILPWRQPDAAPPDAVGPRLSGGGNTATSPFALPEEIESQRAARPHYGPAQPAMSTDPGNSPAPAQQPTASPPPADDVAPRYSSSPGGTQPGVARLQNTIEKPEPGFQR